jgi:hypothetical protein
MYLLQLKGRSKKDREAWGKKSGDTMAQNRASVLKRNKKYVSILGSKIKYPLPGS